MAERCDVVVAGHLCLDVIPDLSGIPTETFKKTFTPGHLVQAGPAAFSTGGPVSNTGLALHTLGAKTRLMGKVGDDMFGRAIRQVIEAVSPHLTGGMIVDPAVNSSYSIVVSPPGLDRYFLHDPGANHTFSAADVRTEQLEKARLFHFGYPPYMRLMYIDDGAQLVELFRRAKDTGVTTSLDTAVPDPASEASQVDWPGIFSRTLPFVDVFLPSIEEILMMLRPATYAALDAQAGDHDILPLVRPGLLADLSRELLAMGPAIVGLKLGNRGFYLRTAGRERLESSGRARPTAAKSWAGKEMWSPCFQVEVAGTLGSGDATIAGFLNALLLGLSPEEAATAATAVGACNVEAADAISGIRPWNEIVGRIEAGWPRHPLTVDAPGWRFDRAGGLWIGPAA